MTRIECLQQIVALEEERERQIAQLEALGAEIRALTKALPPQHPRKNDPRTGRRVDGLKAILAAEEARIELAANIRELNRQLQTLQRDMPSDGLRKAHGELRKIMLAALKTAGSKGVRVPGLAKRHHLDPRNVHAALSGYLKENTMPGLKRIAKGHYVLDH